MLAIHIQTDYKSRMNRVFKYIDQNLDSDLSLEIISGVAFFSPFHFHRIFKSLTGETLNEYVTRKRVEKSAIDLIHSKLGITDITLKNGFSCNSAFTRTFRKFYGVSPTQFKRENMNRHTRISRIKSKNGQDNPDRGEYFCIIENLKKWTQMNAKIEMRTFPKIHLAYVSVIGPDKLPDAYQGLLAWAATTGLMNEAAKLITIYHDSLKITDEQKARMSACITLNGPAKADGAMALTTIEAGNFLVGSYEIELKDFEQAWTGLFIWMNENGYQKRDGNPFEIYHNDFNEHPERKCIVDFCIPVV